MEPEACRPGLTEPLIDVEGLVKLFPVKKGVFGKVVGHVHAVDGVSFAVNRGETLGLVGESGCGKTTVGRAVLRLVEPTGGSVVFAGVQVTRLSASELRAMRKRMQIVFQDPYSSLDPRMTVERIIGEGFVIHGPPKGSKDSYVAKSERTHELIEQVGLSHDHLSRLPHEFSGGQRQRIALARALALDPDFVVLDEPTSALDVSVQAQALNLLKRLQSKLGLSYLFISHDLSVVAHMSDRIAVMYLGKIVEMAPTQAFLTDPMHPYTQALIASIPIPDPKMRKDRKPIEGEVPSPTNPPKGCRFHPRCPKVLPICGWGAQDMIDWMTSQGHLGPKGVVGAHAGPMRADGFVLEIRASSDSELGPLLSSLRAVVDSQRSDWPMLRAVEAVDTVLGNQALVLKCRSLRKKADARPGAKPGRGKKTKKSKKTEKMRPSSVAREVARALDTLVAEHRDDILSKSVLSTDVEGNRVFVRVIGPEANWDKARSRIKDYIDGRKSEKEGWAGAVKGPSLRRVRGPKVAVVVKFKHVDEPQMTDVGGWHQVACHLYTPPGRRSA